MNTHAIQQMQKANTSIFTVPFMGPLQRRVKCRQCTRSGGESAECGTKHEQTFQRTAVNHTPVNEVPPIVHDVLRSPGQPLDPSVRAFMEPRFGHDFSQVRVHSDSKAAESALAVNALAYTVGRDMVFGEGQYAPGTSEGRKLIAHELTHVIQQSGAAGTIQRQLRVGAEGGVSESQANQAAEQTIEESETQVEGVLDLERVMGATRLAEVQLQRRCRKGPPEARYGVDVNLAIPPTPAPNQAHNTAWISARANDRSGRTAGLTELSTRMRWRYQLGRNSNRLWIDRFSAWFERASIRIYLTNEFRVGSCEYNDLLRHEQQHDTDYRANAAQAEAHVCDNATTWPSRAEPWHDLSNAEVRTLIDEWMAFENWQLDYDNWYDGCIWDTVDYPRMYTGCPGVVAARPEADCGEAPRRPVQRGLPLPQKAP